MLAPAKLNIEIIGEIIPFLTDERVEPFISGAFSNAQNQDDRILAVLAPRTDQRMAAQLGNYTIHSGRTPLNTNNSTDAFLARINIPPSARVTIKTELSILGARRSTLFPDLSNLAVELSEMEAFDGEGNLLG